MIVSTNPMVWMPRPAKIGTAAGCIMLAAFLAIALEARGAGAQTPIAAPSIDSITPGDGQLTTAWTAPAGVSGITAYDLRYIETSADETVQGNWMEVQDVWTSGSGDLSYVVTGLTGNAEYAVQVRGGERQRQRPVV